MAFFPLFYGFQLVQELVWLAILLIIVITVTRVRAEPDPGGHRLTACFLAVVMGFSVVVALLASTAAVHQLASLINEDEGHVVRSEWFGFDPSTEIEAGMEDLERFEEFDDSEGFDEGREDDYASALQAGLFAAAATGVFVYHRRKLRALLHDPDVRAGAVGQIAEGYRHVLSFFGLLALAGGAAFAVYGLVRLAAPGVFSVDDVDDARRVAGVTFFVGAWLAVAGFRVLDLHREEESEVEPPIEEAPIP